LNILMAAFLMQFPVTRVAAPRTDGATRISASDWPPATVGMPRTMAPTPAKAWPPAESNQIVGTHAEIEEQKLLMTKRPERVLEKGARCDCVVRQYALWPRGVSRASRAHAFQSVRMRLGKPAHALRGVPEPARLNETLPSSSKSPFRSRARTPPLSPHFKCRHFPLCPEARSESILTEGRGA
jgi:hypothetical protein